MGDSTISPKDFGASFQTFMQQMSRESAAEEPFFRRRLREHFGTDPSKFSIVGDKFSEANHPNVHLAMESYLSDRGRSYELLGISSDRAGFMGIELGHLVSGTGAMTPGGGTDEGPVAYTNVALDGDRVLACTQLGLYLISEGDARLAILVARTERGYNDEIKVQVLAPQREAADACLAALRMAMRKRNVYRGHVVSLSVNRSNTLEVRFHHLPRISREQIILPSGVLERIERESVSFSKHAHVLHAAGRHLKRGMLLHGAPGTGKTLTAMYLAGRMPDRTVLLITGRSMGLLEHACAMARVLQPATIVLEDVDLIAEERTRQGGGGGCAPLLFELLNQMDGLADDADILFVLTTNRPDLLEPALAARPGRIDQAVEVPLPDSDCRRRLFELYSRGLRVSAAIEPYVDRTAGASASFIRELLRKAALFAADDRGELEVQAKHFDEALHEMVVEGGDLMKSLLGASVAATPANPRV
ncbi:MAG: 26S protease regulatory subunit [Kofleriaceae bacterium]|nr:26S protease regulatory subunit [Kofleriaceae bacterium]